MENCLTMMSAMSGMMGDMGAMGITMWLMMIGFTILTSALIVALVVLLIHVLRSNRPDNDQATDTHTR